MNWDKKVVSFQHERGINATQLGPAEAIAANRQARIIARWQRDQLRTPEAIERAADILSFETTGGCYPKADEQCRHVMKEVFDALLGDN